MKALAFYLSLLHFSLLYFCLWVMAIQNMVNYENSVAFDLF